MTMDIDAATAQIGGVFYGGIEPGGDQWDKCRKAATLVLTSASALEPRKVGMFGKAEVAQAAARKFNTQYPIGTEGFCKDMSANRILVRVESEAMVYPDPFLSEVVMVWLHPTGWRTISEFQPKNINPNQDAAELCAAAIKLKAERRNKMAEHVYYAALRADPTYWRAMNDLGVLCHEDGRYDEAVAHFGVALAHEPQAYELYNNRALALRARGDYELALADCEESIRLAPGVDLMALNRASLLDDIGRVDEAVEYLSDYVARRPEKTNVAHNLAISLLSNERLKEGWVAYDARLRIPSANAHYEHFNIPRWQPGEPVAGREILVWTEQGLGDEILTASMIPDLVARGGKVTLLCSDRIHALLYRSLYGIARVEKRASQLHLDMFKRQPLTPEMLPSVVRERQFDCQMSQADLGALLRPTIASFPSVNCLKADEAEARLCKAAYLSADGDATGPLVGISWHSNRNPNIGHLKGVDLKQWEPILRTPGVRFVNLQYGDCKVELQAIKDTFGVDVIDPPVDAVAAFDDFAALVSCMDLVITVSNTTAHVAGGLGVPTWIMVPDGPGRLWYWFRGTGAVCPWYASAKLYRQQRSSQWVPVVEAVARDFAAWVAGRKGPEITVELRA